MKKDLYHTNIGNHTFAALNAHEDYEVINTGMEEVMNQINALIAKPQIKIDDTTYTLEIILGGDYKVCSHTDVSVDKYI